jgi:hypothetical protein
LVNKHRSTTSQPINVGSPEIKSQQPTQPKEPGEAIWSILNSQQVSSGGNHALQDYQMQILLLEQQNQKARMIMIREILNPLLAEPRFSCFHPLVHICVDKIGEGKIGCLRGVEEALVDAARVSES